jgi:hypothetical protein
MLGAGWRQIVRIEAEIDPAPAGRTRRTGADNSLDYLKLYTAAHQKLSRRIKIGSAVRYCLIWFSCWLR